MRAWRGLGLGGKLRSELAMVGVAVLVIGCFAVAQHRTGPKHLLEVTPDLLYRSGTLSTSNLERVVRRYGIRTVVNLRAEREGPPGPWYREQRRSLWQRGVDHVDLPMDTLRPPDPPDVARWLELLDDAERHPILVHCEMGVMRTGMMVAVYQMEFLGYGNQQAMESFEAFGHDVHDEKSRELRDFILNYVPRDRASVETAARAPTHGRVGG